MDTDNFPILGSDGEACQRTENNGMERRNNNATVLPLAQAEESRQLNCNSGWRLLEVTWLNSADENPDLPVGNALDSPDVHLLNVRLELARRMFPHHLLFIGAVEQGWHSPFYDAHDCMPAPIAKSCAFDKKPRVILRPDGICRCLKAYLIHLKHAVNLNSHCLVFQTRK